MSYFSVQFIKTLNKHESKLEIINRGSWCAGKKSRPMVWVNQINKWDTKWCIKA